MISLHDIPNKKWGHEQRTVVPADILDAASQEQLNNTGHIWTAEVFPDYLENKWYIEVLVKTDAGEVKIKDECISFPSEEFRTKLIMVMGK